MKYLWVLICVTGSVSLMVFTSSVVIVAAICLICCYPANGIPVHHSGTPSLVQTNPPGTVLATHTTRRLSKSVEPKVPQ